MRLRIRYLILIMLLSCAVSGQQSSNGVLKVTIVAEDNQPVPSALVLLRRLGPGRPEVRLQLDSAGHGSTVLPVGLYHIFISEDTFVPVCSAIRIKLNEPELFFARLKTDVANLEQATGK